MSATLLRCAKLVMSSLLLAGCASGGYQGSGSDGASGRGSRRTERVVIGSFADVEAVAVSRRFVYAGTTSGIGIYDRTFSRWLPPLTNSGGFADDRITAIAADPVEDALWYGVPGAVVIYRPEIDQLQRTIVVGVPDIIAFERAGNSDVYVRSSGQWTRITRSGMATPVNVPPPAGRLMLPPTLDDVYRQFPSLRGQLSFLMREQSPGRALRNFNPVSGTISPDRTSEVWIGTNGNGLWKVDPTFQQGTPLRFGPIEEGVGALALTIDGVWIAGLGQSQLRGGIAFGSDDLQRWEWIEGTIAVPMIGVRTHAMTVRGQRAWVATDRGVVRVHLDVNRSFQFWGLLDGLPGERVLSLAARNDGVWAGTDRGLAWIADTADVPDRRTRGIGRVLLEGVPVHALAAVGDTLWIGTETGLVALPGSDAALARSSSDDPALRRRIRALAWSDSTLLVATDETLLRVAPRGGSAPQRIDVDIRAVGQVTKVAIDARTMWIAGSDGVLVVQRQSGLVRLLRSGFDLPGPALDVVASDEWLWIGTPGGLVRIRRAADGGLP